MMSAQGGLRRVHSADQLNSEINRLHNSNEAAKRGAAKWRRAVEIVNWMATQLPPGSKYQILGFNTKAEPLVGATPGWLDAGDVQALARNVAALHSIVPRDGTSLI